MFVYINLETQRNAGDTEGWHPEKMGLSVAVALTGTRLHIFTDEDINELVTLMESADTVVGYNIEDFDFNVLAGYPGVSLDRVQRLDLMKDLEAFANCRVALGSVTTATIGEERDQDGLGMVKLWKDRRMLPIVEHCTSTVLQLKALHEYGRQHGHVFHHCGGKEKTRIDVSW